VRIAASTAPVEVLQDPADGRGVRHHRADAEPLEDRAAGAMGVLADRGERPRPGQDRARPEQQDGWHTMADPAGVAWVGDLGERLHQRQRGNRRGVRVEGDLRMIEGDNDRGDCWCGHGLPDLIKDLA
jgi:hypothetical protein